MIRNSLRLITSMSLTPNLWNVSIIFLTFCIISDCAPAKGTIHIFNDTKHLEAAIPVNSWFSRFTLSFDADHGSVEVILLIFLRTRPLTLFPGNHLTLYLRDFVQSGYVDSTLLPGLQDMVRHRVYDPWPPESLARTFVQEDCDSARYAG